VETSTHHSQSISTVVERELVTYPVIDAEIVGTTMPDALGMVMNRAETAVGGYACFVNAHLSVMTRQEPRVQSAIAGSTYAFAAGA
jgi:UDP-N-acetyl-D-mannosaminuronic acid transferase (WecB/TagA/CpsF family)